MRKIIFILLPFLLVFSGCFNLFESIDIDKIIMDDNLTDADGNVGRIIINDEPQGRTLFPVAPKFVLYELSFKFLDEDGADINDQTAVSLPFSVNLIPGQWLITVTGYTRIEGVDGLSDGNYKAATGSATVTVASGSIIPVTINLSNGTGIEGSGVLEYDIGLPENISGNAVLRVLDPYRNEIEIRNLLEKSFGNIVLDSGYYLLQVQITTGRARSKTELVHVYSGHITRAAGSSWNFNAEAGTFLTVTELSEFLFNAPQNTVNNPYPVKLIANLGTLSVQAGPYYHESLGLLFKSLHGRYIDLDLSEAAGAINDSDHGNIADILLPDRDKLVSVILPEGLTHLGHGAFALCTSLRSVVLPSSLKSIGIYNIGNYSYSSFGVFEGCSSLEEIIFPASFQNIGIAAFRNCTSLVQTTLSNTVQSIGFFAFSNCTSLEQVNFPASIQSIGECAFEYTALKTADLSACYLIETINNHVFSNCQYLETVKLPPNLTIIPNTTFFRCSSLSDINIPATVTAIGALAFGECNSLTKIALPAAVENIGDGAFFECNNLTLEIPGSSRLETIGAGALAFGNRKALDLSGLKFLKSIDFSAMYPSSNRGNYDSLETLNLSDCVRLANIYGLQNIALKLLDLTGIIIPPVLSSAFSQNSHEDFVIYVSSGSVNAYRTAPVWSNYSSQIHVKP